MLYYIYKNYHGLCQKYIYFIRFLLQNPTDEDEETSVTDSQYDKKHNDIRHLASLNAFLLFSIYQHICYFTYSFLTYSRLNQSHNSIISNAPIRTQHSQALVFVTDWASHLNRWTKILFITQNRYNGSISEIMIHILNTVKHLQNNPQNKTSLNNRDIFTKKFINTKYSRRLHVTD